MIPDLDTYRSANVLVKQRDQDAPIQCWEAFGTNVALTVQARNGKVGGSDIRWPMSVIAPRVTDIG